MRLLTLAATLLLSLTAAHAQQTALLGAWQCQTPQGAASLSFGNNGTLSFNGDVTQYIVQGNVITAMVDGFPTKYRYQVSGNVLAIANPDGSRTQCQRGGASGNMAQASGSFNGALQGTLCGYSGSSSGSSSYSSTRRVTFDGQGRFATGSESSFSNAAGLGYGGGSGSGGTYRVTAVQVGAPIHVRWANGEDDQATVHHIVNGRITEVRYGKMVFGRALCG
jgi:YD repeat-containing protein